MTELPRPRTVAFYLPQYHRIPENDEWWGDGFSDWTNVRKAKPLFAGHDQPHVPSELGYYDLAQPGTLAAQALLARRYNVDAFCYYHYWFQGRRLLELPVDEMLRSQEPEMPFCLCWANEPWTRTWDGSDNAVLMVQSYSPEDDVRHIEWLLTVFADERYLRVDGRPVFLVYRTSSLPHPARTAEVWRERARNAGFPDLFLCRLDSSTQRRADPRSQGFDAAVEFQPDTRMPLLRRPARRRELLRRLGLAALASGPRRVDYASLASEALARPEPEWPWFPCVVPSWDNTARRPWAPLVVTDSSPERFGEWTAECVRRLRHRPRERQILFVNAWNEWAEGCHLEPCQRWDRAYLEVFSKAVTS